MSLKVLITVNTEVWPWTKDSLSNCLDSDVSRDILGRTSGGEFGLNYILRNLNTRELRATFFVEALFADAVGMEPLRDTVRAISEAGQDVQLHAHTEWLDRAPQPILPGRSGSNLNHFSLDEQSLIIARALRNLVSAGARTPVAFRAGNFGANWNTLAALSRNGLTYDSSHDAAYLTRECAMPSPAPVLHPSLVSNVWEFPIACFRDWPGHLRHAQLCACSSLEIEHALLQACDRSWPFLVILLHSFELIDRRRLLADPVVVRRFNRLCDFLHEHRDTMQTVSFSELAPPFCAQSGSRQLGSNPLRTLHRIAQQCGRRLS